MLLLWKHAVQHRSIQTGNNQAFSPEQHECVNAQSQRCSCLKLLFVGLKRQQTPGAERIGQLFSEKRKASPDTRRPDDVEAMKWSLFHRPLAAGRLMLQLSALLSSIMFLRNASF
jgi:hypothetical protein